LQHNDTIVNDLTSSRSRPAAAIWLMAAVFWLPAIAFLALRAALPWDGAWASLIAPRPGQITIVRTTPGSALREGDMIVAVAGRDVGQALRQATRRPLSVDHTPATEEPLVYEVSRDGRQLELLVSRQPIRFVLPLRRWGILLFGLVFQLVGAFLLRRRPRDPAARTIFVTAACLLSYSVTRAADLWVSELFSGPSWWLLLFLSIVANAGWMLGLVRLALLFPRPHAWRARRRRWLIALTLTPAGWIAATTIVTLTHLPDPLPGISRVTYALLLAQLAWFVLAAIFFATNYRSLDADDQQRARWVMLAFLSTLIMGLALSILPDAFAAPARQPRLDPELATLRNNLIWVAALVIPFSFAVAILRHRLFDIDLAINRALVWGALTALTMGLYVLIVGALSGLFRASNSPLAFFLATGVVAVLFQPARQRLQRAVNRLMYGERDDPYAVLSRLGQRLGGALAADAVAPAVVESIAAALKLPYVALMVGSNGFNRSEQPAAEAATANHHGRSNGFSRVEEPLAAWGKRPAYPSSRLPLTHQGQTVGELLLAPRGPGETFSPADRRLLDDLAKQAGVALYAAQQTWQAQRLAEDLQHSRERLVTAREEERRRLRRDLHDGLGPALASLTLKVDAARDELSYDAASAAAMLDGVKGDIQAAVSDIRRLVYELRPPALDDLGLVASLRLLVERYRGTNLTIACDLPERLPSLPAAVEVAVYRISAEALTNVVRHATARTCGVRLTVAERVELTISDDGCGLPPDAAAGVGLISMRERAAELGGDCVIASAPGAGTTVRVWLPLS
jgi:signal transduction histidine kinase